MSLWADYSFARPDLAQLKALGVVGVLRYLSPVDQNTQGKVLSPVEKDAILHAGLDLCLNFEWYAGRCLEGFNAGLTDGGTALGQAKALGYPQGKTIYFSHDTGQYNWAAIDAYYQAVRQALGGYYKLGAYGSFSLVQQLHAAGLIDKGWQTLAWSGGQRDTWSVIYQTGQQILGGSADINEVTSTDIGSWLDGPTPEVDLDANQDYKLNVLYDTIAKLPLDLLVDQQNQGLIQQAQKVLGDLDIRLASLQKQEDTLTALVNNLQVIANSGIDIPKLVKAINDDAAARMAN
jgi:hypothetical protein